MVALRRLANVALHPTPAPDLTLQRSGGRRRSAPAAERGRSVSRKRSAARAQTTGTEPRR